MRKPRNSWGAQESGGCGRQQCWGILASLAQEDSSLLHWCCEGLCGPVFLTLCSALPQKLLFYLHFKTCCCSTAIIASWPMKYKDLGPGAGMPCCYRSTQSCQSSSTLMPHCGSGCRQARSISKASHTAQCLAQQISYPQPRGSLHDASSLHPTSRGLNLPLGRIWNLPQLAPFPTSAQHVFAPAS